ncbi:MAG: HAD family hydrolase [Candidatus Wildermuthbacteria bacterium]|nr:HAD family hydrolase [Candidatus Wildermuthbacteria bacterium]
MDAMFTIFVAKMGRWRLYQLLLERFAEIRVSEEAIELIYKEERRKKEAEPLPEGKLPPGFYRRYWSAINAALVRRLDPSIADARVQQMGEQIFSEVMGNPEFFMVSEEMLTFLKEAVARGYALWVVSNQEPEGLVRLMEAFKVSCFFTGVLASDSVGFQKPDPHFFEVAIGATGLPRSHLAFIGNNPRNDMKGAERAGIPNRYLYDPDGEHAGTPREVFFVSLKRPVDLFDYF